MSTNQSSKEVKFHTGIHVPRIIITYLYLLPGWVIFKKDKLVFRLLFSKSTITEIRYKDITAANFKRTYPGPYNPILLKVFIFWYRPMYFSIFIDGQDKPAIIIRSSKIRQIIFNLQNRGVSVDSNEKLINDHVESIIALRIIYAICSVVLTSILVSFI